MTKTKVVIIIPTYNEAGNIAPVTKALSRIVKPLTAYQFTLLFVDDSSPDGTAREIAKVAKTSPSIKLIKNREKSGLGHAYKKGMRYALDKLQAEIVFEFDADLSHDPAKIPAMLDKITQGADLVLGSRYLPGGGIPANWGLHRKFLSVVGNLFIKTVMLNFRVSDWTTGFRAIRRSVVERIIPELGSQRFTGYTWQIGFLVKSIQAGFHIAEVPFIFVDRTRGQSKLGPEYIINNLVYIMKFRLQDLLNHRLFKFAVTGGIGALIQLTTLQLYRANLPFQLAFFLSIETAIVSNFIFSNLWTFADRKLKAGQIPGKFLAFNLASGGSILIQQAVAFVGETFIGLFPLYTFHLSSFTFDLDSGTMYAVTGILLGMFWNFFAYSRIIWKKKK